MAPTSNVSQVSHAYVPYFVPATALAFIQLCRGRRFDVEFMRLGFDTNRATAVTQTVGNVWNEMFFQIGIGYISRTCSLLTIKWTFLS